MAHRSRQSPGMQVRLTCILFYLKSTNTLIAKAMGREKRAPPRPAQSAMLLAKQVMRMSVRHRSWASFQATWLTELEGILAARLHPPLNLPSGGELARPPELERILIGHCLCRHGVRSASFGCQAQASGDYQTVSEHLNQNMDFSVLETSKVGISWCSTTSHN